MERLLVFLGSFLFVSLCRGQVLCNEKKCPQFKVVDETENYEERYYQATEWISTKMENDDVWAAHSKLKSYSQRQELQGFKVAVDTWPVLITERPDGRYMSWFLSPGTIKPKNDDSDVKLESRPAGTVYVRIFDGKLNLERAKKNKELLQKSLEEALKDFDRNSYNAAFFEPFFYLIHHNEVWIRAANHD